MRDARINNSKIIGRGAEAVIYLDESSGSVSKERLKKSYRIEEIDNKLRKLRTRSEARLMERASKIINTPKIISSSEKDKIISMSYIRGKKLSDALNSLNNSLDVCRIIGESVAKLHDANIIHGDLTTSNIILRNGKVYFIDFGLSFYSEKIEDKAVDVHLFKQALEARHFNKYDTLLRNFLEGYKNSKNYDKVLQQLNKVEARGRYRH